MPSLTFNGTTQYARSTTAVATAFPFSMSIWAYPTSDTGASMVAIGLCASGSINNAGLALATSTLTVNATCNDGTTNTPAISSAGLTLSTWNHLCGTWTSATARAAYLNGGSKGTSATSRTPTGLARTSVGVRDTSAQAQWFAGQLANGAIWNSTLTDAEALALAGGISPLKIQPHALIWFAPYFEIGGANIQDWFGHPLAITGATTSTNTPPKVGHP